MKDTCISERVDEYSPMDIRKLRTSTKEEVDRPPVTEAEYVWNIYTHVFITERRCVLCEV